MWIFPSSDVHLIRGTALQQQALRVFTISDFYGISRGAWLDAGTSQIVGQPPFQLTLIPRAWKPLTSPLPTVTSLPDPSGVITVSAADQPGSVLFECALRAGPFRASHIARVTTHASLIELFSGQTTCTVMTGGPRRILSVYARVPPIAGAPDLPQIVDITGHAGLRYSVSNNAVRVHDDGRVEGLQPATTAVVTIAVGGLSVTTTVIVRPLPLAMSADEFDLDVHQFSPEADRRVYVIAEGYTSSARFFEDARSTVNSWLTSPHNRPFDYLAPHYESISIFLRSQEQGISIAGRLVSAAPAGPWSIWNGALPIPWADAITLQRDTAHGLCWGERTSGPHAPKMPTDTNVTIEQAFTEVTPGSDRSPAIDDRRLRFFALDDPPTIPVDPREDWNDYLSWVVSMSGYAYSPPNDRIVFLIDDDHYGGIQLSQLLPGLPQRQDVVALSLGTETDVQNVIVQNVIGHPGQPLLDRRDRRMRAPYKRDYSVLGSRLAHEIAHTYQLGDEYQEALGVQPKRHYSDLVLSTEVDYNIESDSSMNATYPETPGSPYLPLTGDSAAVPPLLPGSIDRRKIKWNHHRIERVSVADTVEVFGQLLVVSLGEGQSRRWATNDRVFLRRRIAVTNMYISADSLLPVVRGDIEDINAIGLMSIRVVDDTIGEAADILGMGPDDPQPLVNREVIMYQPVRGHSSVPQRLIPFFVMEHLRVHGPFRAAGSCQATAANGNAPFSPPPIEHYDRPSPMSRTIGVYEGGGEFSCDVYRPTGDCKLRRGQDQIRRYHQAYGNQPEGWKDETEIVPFCFVCMYTLVDIIDPSQHEKLDKSYPRG